MVNLNLSLRLCIIVCLKHFFNNTVIVADNISNLLFMIMKLLTPHVVFML